MVSLKMIKGVFMQPRVSYLVPMALTGRSVPAEVGWRPAPDPSLDYGL